MSAFQFKRALREDVQLLIGIAGGTGSGKTFSAMRIAKGIAGTKPFAVLDTEAGRAKHYADQFTFDHGDLKPPFRPRAYQEAIVAADEAGYPVIVVDSMSHEHAGAGGLLEMFDENWQRMGAKESMKMLAWVEPKTEHKAMVQRLLQIRAHLILCFRAEEKIEMVKVNGKMEVRPKESAAGRDGWVPVVEKTLPFECTASFLLLASNPGYPLPIKLQEQHKAIFPLDKPLSEASGKAIAEWSRGGGPMDLSKIKASFKKAKVPWPDVETHVGKPEQQWIADDVEKAREFYKVLAASTKKPAAAAEQPGGTL